MGRPSSPEYRVTWRAEKSGASAIQTLRSPFVVKTHPIRPACEAATRFDGNGELRTCSSVKAAGACAGAKAESNASKIQTTQVRTVESPMRGRVRDKRGFDNS